VKDIDDFIRELPKNEREIVRRLRMLVLEADPRIKEQFSYGVPYYFRKRRVCFIWPSSSKYGPKDALVSFGFCYGNQLSNEQGILLAEGRKQVRIIKYDALNKVDDEVIAPILQEALLVDQLTNSSRKK